MQSGAPGPTEPLDPDPTLIHSSPKGMSAAWPCIAPFEGELWSPRGPLNCVARFFFSTSALPSCGEDVIAAIPLSLQLCRGVRACVCAHTFGLITLNLCPRSRGYPFRAPWWRTCVLSLSVVNDKSRRAGRLPEVAPVVRGLGFAKPRAVLPPSLQPSGCC